jgi:hypothetical protein
MEDTKGSDISIKQSISCDSPVNSQANIFRACADINVDFPLRTLFMLAEKKPQDFLEIRNFSIQ